MKQLSQAEGTISVSIESTLGRHLVLNGQDLCLREEPMADTDLVTGAAGQRGKALIICYKKTKGHKERKDWVVQFCEAYTILSEQFGLEVNHKSEDHVL